jgi:hypothetical protein
LQANTSQHLACKRNLGAALITSHPVYSEDEPATLDLSEYMVKHYPAWVTHAREELGCDVGEEDIIHVTGVDLTKQWATATFMDRTSEVGVQASFNVSEFISGGLRYWGSWITQPRVSTHCGPVAPAHQREAEENLNPGVGVKIPAEAPSDYNQCIFIRGFRVRSRTSFMNKIETAATSAQRYVQRYQATSQRFIEGILS